MSENLLIRHCSPTLAGLKTASLFACHFADEQEMRENIRGWNQVMVKKGLRVLPLQCRENRALIYIYRTSGLTRDLQHEDTRRLLAERGYCCDSPERCIVHLVKRLEESSEFPHEIGCFLGYPPEDVCGFIENRACNCKCVGCWKVYGDVDEAQKKFARYQKCTNVYSRVYEEGRTIEQLTVAG